MMMIRQQQPQPQQQHPTVEIPLWDPPYDDSTATVFSPQTNAYFSSSHRFLPSFETHLDDSFSDAESHEYEYDSSDDFRMYEFKIWRCARGRSHDWTDCPFAHPGEKARRRDPRKFHYSGTPCPDFRRGCCPKGDSCEFAHGVFECWLHPARYRTQPCKDGVHCNRRVCFFAHTPGQLRILPNLPESPPSRLAQLGVDSAKHFEISPTSVMDRHHLYDTPPMSPSYSDSVSELVNSVRGLEIGNMGGGLSMSPRSGPWSVKMGGCSSGFGSPRSPTGLMGGYCGTGSLPCSLTPTPTRAGLGLFDSWEASLEEEVPMERVESGKNVRARMYAKLSNDNSLDGNWVDSGSVGPDFGWVSELVK